MQPGGWGDGSQRDRQLDASGRESGRVGRREPERQAVRRKRPGEREGRQLGQTGMHAFM